MASLLLAIIILSFKTALQKTAGDVTRTMSILVTAIGYLTSSHLLHCLQWSV